MLGILEWAVQHEGVIKWQHKAHMKKCNRITERLWHDHLVLTHELSPTRHRFFSRRNWHTDYNCDQTASRLENYHVAVINHDVFLLIRVRSGICRYSKTILVYALDLYDRAFTEAKLSFTVPGNVLTPHGLWWTFLIKENSNGDRNPRIKQGPYRPPE